MRSCVLRTYACICLGIHVVETPFVCPFCVVYLGRIFFFHSQKAHTSLPTISSCLVSASQNTSGKMMPWGSSSTDSTKGCLDDSEESCRLARNGFVSLAKDCACKWLCCSYEASGSYLQEVLLLATGLVLAFWFVWLVLRDARDELQGSRSCFVVSYLAFCHENFRWFTWCPRCCCHNLLLFVWVRFPFKFVYLSKTFPYV